jgi:hypothetical protein
MQQRRLRLGDILDDYCPRERRITNHAVVAMIEDQVKQTRCTTCDADHPYKDGKAPSPRRKKSEGALFHDVLENARPRVLATPTPIGAAADLAEEPPPLAAFAPPLDEPMLDEAMQLDEPMQVAPFEVAEAADAATSVASDDAPHDDEPAAERTSEDEWPVHRRLIRATLPRPEGQVPERKEPEFTMHRPLGRGVDGNRSTGQRARSGGHRHGRPAQGRALAARVTAAATASIVPARRPAITARRTATAPGVRAVRDANAAADFTNHDSRFTIAT